MLQYSSRRPARPAIESLESRSLLSATFYASDSGDQLYTVNTLTGSTSVIGHMGVNMYDIAENAQGQLYGVDASSALYHINSSTAAVTLLGSLNLAVNSLVFSADGILYGASDALYRINPLNGAPTRIGFLGNGLQSGGDLAFDKTGQLYLSTTAGTLAKVNPVSGVATTLGPTGFSGVLGLAYGNDGVLYGMSNDSRQVFSLSLATGKGTAVSTFSGVQSVFGAASMPVSPSAPKLIAPTAGTTVGLTPTFQVKSSDPQKLNLTYEVVVAVGSTSKTFTTGAFASGATGSFQVPLTAGLPQGAGSWKARATDSQVNVGAWSGTRSLTLGAGLDFVQSPTSTQWGQMYAAGARYYVSRAFGGINADSAAASRLLAARQAGMKTAAYAFINFNLTALSGAQQIDQAVNALGAAKSSINFLAIDVEIDGSLNVAGKLQSTTNAVARIQAAVNEVIKYGLVPIIYTNAYSWNTITGKSTQFSNLPLWETTSAGGADLNAVFTPFGGWTKRRGKQYQIDTPGFGLSKIDLNVFDPALFALH